MKTLPPPYKYKFRPMGASSVELFLADHSSNRKQRGKENPTEKRQTLQNGTQDPGKSTPSSLHPPNLAYRLHPKIIHHNGCCERVHGHSQSRHPGRAKAPPPFNFLRHPNHRTRPCTTNPLQDTHQLPESHLPQPPDQIPTIPRLRCHHSPTAIPCHLGSRPRKLARPILLPADPCGNSRLTPNPASVHHPPPQTLPLLAPPPRMRSRSRGDC